MESPDFPRQTRALFLSDLHLGCRMSKAAESLSVLSQISTELIYLVGDIVDVSRMSRQWYWPTDHQRVLDRIGQVSATGTLVHIVPGNHDECFRIPDYFGTLTSRYDARIEEICRPLLAMQTGESFEFFTITGKRLLVLHGDLFDRGNGNLDAITQAGSRIFDRYNRLLPDRANHLIRGFFKILLTRPDKVERAIIAHAEQLGYDGVIFGHLHRPQLKRVGGFVVANVGDWVENRSFLVESLDGRLCLFNAGTLVGQLDLT